MDNNSSSSRNDRPEWPLPLADAMDGYNTSTEGHMAQDNANSGPVPSKKQRLEELISVTPAREALAPLLGDNVKPGNYSVSAKPGISKSSYIPAALYIAGGDTSRILCLHQDFSAATSACTATKRLQVWKSEGKPGLRVLDPTKPSIGLKEDPNTRIAYTTYGSLLYSTTFAEEVLQWCTHVVLDDYHEWSIDQQIVLVNFAYLVDGPDKLPAVRVYMTAFPESLVFETRLPVVDTQHIQVGALQTNVDPPRPRVLHANDELGVVGYCNWVKTSVDAMVADRTAGQRRILVFCPTSKSVATLTTKLDAHKHDILFVDPRSAESVLNANDAWYLSRRTRHLIVLMRPHFGTRTLFDIQDVFCPSMNEDVVFDHYVAQPALTVRRLPADRIAFLESHANAPGACVHHGFAADTPRDVTAVPVWLEGDCIEYYLKAMHAGPPLESLYVQPDNLAKRLCLSPPSTITYAAGRQMWLQNLFEHPAADEGKPCRLTQDGSQVVEWMLATGLSWTASKAINEFLKNKGHHEGYSDFAASTLICLAVINEYAPPILVRTSTTDFPMRSSATPLATLDTILDEVGSKTGCRARVCGDLTTWLLALEYHRKGNYQEISGWDHIDSFRLGPFINRIEPFARTRGVEFRMPTPELRLQESQWPKYVRTLESVSHQWCLANISRLVCVPILDLDEDFWDKSIVEGWDVGSNLMVRLDPSSLFDVARARALRLAYNEEITETEHGVEVTILLTYRHIYRLPASAGNECLYGVSGLTWMHPGTTETIAMSMGIGEDGFHPATGLAGLITNGLDPNLFEADKLGGREPLLHRHPSLLQPRPRQARWATDEMDDPEQH